MRMGQATTFGPDLSYDFTIRGGWISALLTGDVRLLKLQMELMRTSDVGGGQRTIHSLQNHDELVANFNYDESNPDELFPVLSRPLSPLSHFPLTRIVVWWEDDACGRHQRRSRAAKLRRCFC